MKSFLRLFWNIWKHHLYTDRCLIEKMIAFTVKIGKRCIWLEIKVYKYIKEISSYYSTSLMSGMFAPPFCNDDEALISKLLLPACYGRAVYKKVFQMKRQKFRTKYFGKNLIIMPVSIQILQSMSVISSPTMNWKKCRKGLGILKVGVCK